MRAAGSARLHRPRRRKQRIIRTTIHLFVWLGAAVLYYIGFSIFFDTPFEAQMKHSADGLRREYEALSAEVQDLKSGKGAIEERARSELGLIKPGEVFYQVVDPTSANPKTDNGNH